ncbi:MAG: helix-turn-helix transcriptional regulator [Bacteroidales bacterium]|nr:helix-turn-helix transcriptional regulator [Bacteroidales bacterium]
MKDGSYFKKIRKEMHYSQEELAERMGVTRGTYINLEAGKTKIVTDSVLKFCQATGISLLEVIQACYPEFCSTLLREDAQYKQLLKQTVDEYEDRLTAKNEELKQKEQMYTLLQETVKTQRKLIEFYEQPSAKKD